MDRPREDGNYSIDEQHPESAWRKAVEAAAIATWDQDERRSAAQPSDYPYHIEGWATIPETWKQDHREDATIIITAAIASLRESGADIPKIEGEPTVDPKRGLEI